MAKILRRIAAGRARNRRNAQMSHGVWRYPEGSFGREYRDVKTAYKTARREGFRI